MAVGNHQRGTTKEPKNRYPSTDSLVEKELNVDKLELSRRLTLPREEGNQSKILERLHCDAQKLRNLQITIQDLMKKVEINEKSTKGKSVEFGEVKGHQSKLTWVARVGTTEVREQRCEGGHKGVNGKEIEWDEFTAR
ncbi:hypothetical protein JHK84_055434 [Glycine max]|nr:hypothetical protein JHK86_055393 [Glycine max]KAG4918125.1 hypothetical protein JHK85_056406 [Glycine max]KAG5074203.1 hypothetical protein JHK84_055434 [Glycine max]